MIMELHLIGVEAVPRTANIYRCSAVPKQGAAPGTAVDATADIKNPKKRKKLRFLRPKGRLSSYIV